jgi:hypothetical protein
MSVKICGHKVQWHKPIKTFTLVKHHLCLLMALCLFAVSPALADESAEQLSAIKTSSGDTVTGQSPHVTSGTETKSVSTRTQRAAGSPSMSPALALALALGMRNVSGPVLKTTHVAMEP